MNYYELRSLVSHIVPRMTQLTDRGRHQGAVQEKGRKVGYKEFKLAEHKWVKQERLLNVEEINSFAEISCRAAACPIPLNLDVWDGLLCPYNCRYCLCGDSQISMADGTTKPIREIQTGDKVLGWVQGKVVKDIVTHLFPIRKAPVMKIKAGGRVLFITDNHEVLTSNRGWVEAGKLHLGDFLFNLQEENPRFYTFLIPIKSIEPAREDPIEVYNFETLHTHTYFADGFLVHNCFANAFRASLYTAFFDNSKTMGMRHCNPDKFKRELDHLMKFRGNDPHSINNDVAKAFAMEMPVRLGIRFEDFMEEEAKEGISLQLLQYLAKQEYPVMVNTKSALIGTEPYVKALVDNKAKAAVHVTLISSSNKLLSLIEPGAPSYEQRIGAMAALVKAEVRVVARIEPFLPFVNDDKEDVDKYMKDMKRIGVKNITFDTYSYSANNPGIRQNFLNCGIDWERIFTIGCDSQALGSLLLGKFMEMFRENGFSCSTFDMGNVPDNNQSICCEVNDWFRKSGFNYGCSVMATRFIMEDSGQVSWSQFEEWVDENGGFLSPALKQDVHELWNMEGNEAYSHAWARGMEAVGWDENGMIWQYQDKTDFRMEMLKGMI